ncbi:MAG: hypothetical protein JEZ04_17720 [Spirochaetales bacterium]|nr:hypothetical protein [Spirochaetales bacterium]
MKKIFFVLSIGFLMIITSCSTTTVFNPNSLSEEELNVLHILSTVRVREIDGENVTIFNWFSPAKVLLPPGEHTFKVWFRSTNWTSSLVSLTYEFESGNEYIIDPVVERKYVAFKIIPIESMESYYKKKNENIFR